MRLLALILLPILLLLTGCDTQHQVSFHGQIISITPSSRGYVAKMVTDHGEDGTYFTIAQANTYKIGDIVDWTSSYDMVGEWVHLDSIQKVK